jgi:hypothetical protein
MLARRGKKDTKLVGKLDNVLLIKIILPVLDDYNRFQPAKRWSIFSIMPYQIDLDLKEAPNGRPRFFIGNEETLNPRS